MTKLFLILFFSICSNSFASVESIVKTIKGSEQRVKKNYMLRHQKYFKELCSPGTEEKYWDLVKKFRGEGFYIPRNIDGTLDRTTIKKYLPIIMEKKAWISNHIDHLLKKDNFKVQIREIESFEKDIRKLLLLKERYYESKDVEQKGHLKGTSYNNHHKLAVKIQNYLKTVPYFHSFQFPVDHLDLRKRYDEHKKSKNNSLKVKSNSIYFYRKLVQDGSYANGFTRSDRYMRAMIDTIYIRLSIANPFLKEDMRFDIESMFTKLKKHMKRGVHEQVDRMKRWGVKVDKSLSFYKSLYDGKVKLDGVAQKSSDFVFKRNLARKNLKDYVETKEAKSYRYWSKQSEVDQALFVLSTILFNEVGTIDGHDALERKDVSHVVINRHNSKKYNSIPVSDPLFSRIKLSKKKIDEHKWLNVLFREGEFSFTYYFIGSSVRIFCPDMTRRGRKIRYKNLSISINELKKTDKSFNGMRYFSRASMLGRIYMDSLWKNYSAIAERVGKRIRNPKKLMKRYNNGRYKYLYHFFNPKNVLHKVVRIGGTRYVLNMINQKFYTYRDPHYFRYFQTKSN
jgi:hypothetical protein